MNEEEPQYHLLPKDDPDRVVAILRAAAGLPPLSDEADSRDAMAGYLDGTSGRPLAPGG